MPALVQKTFTAHITKAAKKGGPIVAVVSTEDIDSFGDIVKQGKSDQGDGWLLDEYNKSGRVYWMHNPFQPNLAKASARVEGRQLLLTIEFDKADELAMELDRKYREGFLSEWSVGFEPMAEKYEENEHGGVTYYESRLIEVSAVNRGANAHTETISKMFGIGDKLTERLDAQEARLHELETQLMRAVTAEAEWVRDYENARKLSEWKRNIRGTA